MPETQTRRPIARQSESMHFGMEVAPITEENRRQFALSPTQVGIVVTKIRPESASAAAGLSVGDVIESVQLEPMNSPADAHKQLQKARAEHRAFVIGLVKGTAEPRYVTLPVAGAND